MKKRASYGIMKENTIGGIFMPRSYSHVQEYETEIISLKEQGKKVREIGEQLGFAPKQVHNFLTRYKKRQRESEAGIALKRKGRPRKDETALPPSIQQLSRASQLQYELATKEREIKRLKMENELMRDFLLLTERK